MKKNIFWIMVAIAITAILPSCSSSEEPDIPDNSRLIFEFATVNRATDGVTVRSAPYSSEATHKVARASVYAFKDDGGGNYLWVKTYDNITWPGVGESFGTYVVPDDQKLAPGDYKLLAVGREATDSYTLTTPTTTTNFNDFSASMPYPKVNRAIFAGSADISVSPTGGGRVSIQLTRKVAGIIGYFSNVPTQVGGTAVGSVHVVITSPGVFGNTSVNLTTGLGSVNYNQVISIIDVLNINQQEVDASIGDGVYKGNDLSSQGVSKVANTQLNGSFVIPTMNVSMSVVLSPVGAPGTALKSWKVLKDGSPTFNLDANSFYSIGVKKSNTSTDGDNPIDLNKEETFSLTILPNWQVVNDLTIE